VARIVIINLTYDHINDSFFIQCYTETEIIGSLQGHIDHYPKTQLVKLLTAVLLHIPVLHVMSQAFLYLEHSHKTFQQKSLLSQGSGCYAYSLSYGSDSQDL
jgi:hypothetical protein